MLNQRISETNGELRFLRVVAGCRMTDRKRNEDTREEMGTKDSKTIATYEK
jgi:hypothetical protein